MKGNSQRGKSNARSLRKSETDAERTIWQLLRSRNLNGTKFRRQHPIGPYIVDFININGKLIIELDGNQHQQKQDYDAERTQRFWNRRGIG